MNDEAWVDPRKVAAVVYDVGVAVDELLLMFAGDLRASGVRVGGVVHVPRGEPGCGARALLSLQDLATGETFPLCEALGPGARDCAMAPASVLQAALRIRAATQSAEVILVSRFGKEEARGRGFREELARAMAEGRPVLTAVRRGMVESWLSFTGGVGTLLDTRLWVLKDWWWEIDRSSARRGTQRARRESEAPLARNLLVLPRRSLDV